MLLQVLFHARIAQEATHGAFTIDDVADSPVRKLGNRVPAVLSGESISLEDQLAQWEERKAQELTSQARQSCVDDIPPAQPALALAQKVIERVVNAGFPVELMPATMTTVTLSPGGDAEVELRSAVLGFMDAVRDRARCRHLPGNSATDRRSRSATSEWRWYWGSPNSDQPSSDLPSSDQPSSVEPQ